MVALSLYRGNLHRVPDVPRQWITPTPKISLKDFKILLNRRSRALSRLHSSNPNPNLEQQQETTPDANTNHDLRLEDVDCSAKQLVEESEEEVVTKEGCEKVEDRDGFVGGDCCNKSVDVLGPVAVCEAEITPNLNPVEVKTVSLLNPSSEINKNEDASNETINKNEDASNEKINKNGDASNEKINKNEDASNEKINKNGDASNEKINKNGDASNEKINKNEDASNEKINKNGDASNEKINKNEDASNEKEKRKTEVEAKLQILQARKHNLVQVLKQILNAEEELKRRSSSCSSTQGMAVHPTTTPLQVDVTNDSGSMTRHLTPQMGTECGDIEGAENDNILNHNMQSSHLLRTNSTSPSSDSPHRRAFNAVPHASRATFGVASSPSRFAPTGQLSGGPLSNMPPAVSVSGTNYVMSSPSPAASGGTSVFRDARLPSPWN